MPKNSKLNGKQDNILLGGVCKSETKKSIVSRRLSIMSTDLPKMTPVPKIKQPQQKCDTLVPLSGRVNVPESLAICRPRITHPCNGAAASVDAVSVAAVMHATAPMQVKQYDEEQSSDFTEGSEKVKRNTQVLQNKTEDIENFLNYISCEMEKMNYGQVQKFKKNVLKSLIVAMDDIDDSANSPAESVNSTSHAGQHSCVINSAHETRSGNQQNTTIQYGTGSSIVCKGMPQASTSYFLTKPDIPVNRDMVPYNKSLFSVQSTTVMRSRPNTRSTTSDLTIKTCLKRNVNVSPQQNM